MGKYTKQELDAMALDDPMKYFYYSNEDLYKSYGIDIEREGWDTPFYHRAGEKGNRNNYEYFYAMVCSVSGATVLTPNDELINISTDGIVVNAKDFRKEPKFVHEEPLAAPKKLGFWFMVLYYFSFGSYGRDRYNTYKVEKDEHDMQTRRYNEAKKEFEETTLADFKARRDMVESYKNGLTQIGKDPEKCAKYTNKIKAEMKKIQSQRDSIDEIIDWRRRGKNRLDYLMGPRRDAAKNEQVKNEILEFKVFNDYVFDDPANYPDSAENHVMDIPLPECKGLTDHEIALIGFAAMCDTKLSEEAYRRPIPGGAEIEDKRNDDEKLHDHGMWHNYTEALFARQKRDCTASIPWVNNARADTAAALEKYNNGDKSVIGEMLAHGIRRCSDNTLFHDSVNDSNTLADYAVYTAEMLAILEKDPKLRDEAVKAGLNEHDLHNAAITANIATVWERGVDAMAALKDNPDMTTEQKTAAMVDIIGMRIAQTMIHVRTLEIKATPEFSTMRDNAVETMESSSRRLNKFKDEQKGTPEYKQCQADFYRSSVIIASSEQGNMFSELGLPTEYGENIEGMFFGKQRPNELRSMIAKQIDFNDLSKLSCDEIITEMQAINSQKYVSHFFPKEKNKQPQAKDNAPQLGVQLNNNNGVKMQAGGPVK